jgi:GNAT superfamily N-acetyltransferase
LGSADDIRIREITPRDAPEAAVLCAELGYPVTVDALRHRIEYLMCQPDHVIFVACYLESVVGWIDVSIAHHLCAEPRGEIAGLVVSSGIRSQGIGRLLVARAEQWALSRGLKEMLVRSRTSREDAHRFYLREGYERTKTSAVFGKHLASAALVN